MGKKKAGAKKVMAKKTGAKKTGAKKKAGIKKGTLKKVETDSAVAVDDDLMAPARKSEVKGKISIIRRAFAEGAEQGLGFVRTVWSDIWDKRSLRDFALKNGQRTRGAILTNPVPIPLHTLVTNWVSGKQSFASRDHVRCSRLRFDEEGHLVETGKECAACTFLGQPPKIFLIFGIGDIRTQFDKDGNQIAWSVKRILLNNFSVRDAIIDAVEMAATRERRDADIAGSLFQITRGTGSKIPRIGDVWVYERFVNMEGATFKKMIALLPDWNEEYPLVDAETMKAMCQIHMNVGSQNTLNNQDMWDEEGAQELFGKSKTATKSSGKSKTEEEEDDLMGPAAGSTKGPSLSEMDDLEDMAEKEEEEEEEVEEKEEEEETEEEIEIGTQVIFEELNEGPLAGTVSLITDKNATVEVEENGEVYEYEVPLEDLTVVDGDDDDDNDLPFPEEEL